MAISRLDVTPLRKALDSLYRFLENPSFDLSAVQPPDGWQDDPPKWQPDPLPWMLFGVDPSGEVREWSPPLIWNAFCTCNRGNVPIDPKLEAPPEALCHALMCVVIARLAPSGFQPGRENADIADSDLNFEQRLKLQAVRDELFDWRKRERLIQRQSVTTLRVRGFLEDALRVLQQADQSCDTTTGANPTIRAFSHRARKRSKPSLPRNEKRDAWVARKKSQGGSWTEIFDECTKLSTKRKWSMPGSAKSLAEAYYRYLKNQRNKPKE